MSSPTPPAPRIPVSVLTGFLGAGKSTLLNFLLRHPDMAGTAVVVNEYGEVGIDHHLIEIARDDLELIANGCLCCTARGEIVGALLSLHARAQQRGIALRRVIIETTGLAEPGPIVQQLLGHADLAALFAVDSVVTVVDARNVGSTLDEHDIAVRQVTAADQLLLSKTDLVDETAASALLRKLRAMNPEAGIEVLRHGAARPVQFFTGGRHDPASPRYQPGPLLAVADAIRFTPLADGPARGLLRGSGVTPREQDIQTFSLILDEALSECRLIGWLAFMRTLCGPTLLRVKGLLQIEGRPGPTVVHGVQQAFHPLAQLAAWPDADHRSRLVFITRGWGQDVIASALAYLRAP
ncbi:MAG: CobW family GTP-binding protein [Solimonas sp.]